MTNTKKHRTSLTTGMLTVVVIIALILATVAILLVRKVSAILIVQKSGAIWVIAIIILGALAGGTNYLHWRPRYRLR